jgi:hypothetical protein
MEQFVNEIFKEIDNKLISEEVKTKVTELINKTVDNRVDAKTADLKSENDTLKEQIKKCQEELDASKKDISEKEEFLKESARDLGHSMISEFVEKEEILFETVKEYQDASIEMFKEVAETCRAMYEEIALEAIGEFKTVTEASAMEAAAEFKKMREAKDAEAMSKFKTDLLEKADEYIKAQLKETIPQNIMEAASKAAALEPLVENMISVIEKHGISVDKTGFETLKVAKQENVKLSEAVNIKATENVKLNARVKELEKQVKLNSLTEGMTSAQKTKTVQLLESCSVEELEGKFKSIKDIIITESVKPKIVKEKDVRQTLAAELVAKKQVDRIVESINKPVESKTSEMDMWSTNLDRMRRN